MKNPKKKKTVEELTKGYEELAKKKGYGKISKEEFEKTIKKVVEKQDSKDKKK